MKENKWVETIADKLRKSELGKYKDLEIRTKQKIAYGYEIDSYGGNAAPRKVEFETDLAIVEMADSGRWKPRVIVEAKIRSITTHDAITYSHKATQHKAVHPYLRYGVMLASEEVHPLPGRLYRHGENFDFMLSFVTFAPSAQQINKLAKLLIVEVQASRQIEHIVYESKRKDRNRYTLLHRRLHLG